MAQSGYTPISLYYSATATNVPSAGNLVNGELALNITDGKLYYKDNTGSVQLLAEKGGNGVSTFQTSLSGLTPSTATTGAVTLAGTLGVASGGTGLTTLAANLIPYGNGTGAFGSSSSLQYVSGVLVVGPGSQLGGTTNPFLAVTGNTNNYIQQYIFNANTGISASADFVSYPDNGTDAHGWVDMGITSSVYADTTYTCTGPNEAYLFGSAPSGSGKTGNLVYATDSTGTANYHQWYVGGFTQAKSAWKMQLTSSGLQLANALGVAYGGTGVTTTPTNGQLLIGNGTGYTVANLTAGSGVSISNSAGGISISATGSGGTVTSVSFTGGIISVATATTTPALTVAGTSGGIPYFSSGTTWASSAALTANALMIGGGAGAAPSTITTGTGVVTALGVNTGSAGAFVVNGGALGTPSSGTVTNLTGTASININGTVGATTANTGAFTTVSASGVITSTVATGTAPFTVASTTQVANLNAATAGNVTGIVLGANGGTGVANTGKTITIGGNLTFTGAFTTAFTVSANTTLTLPTTGTLLTTTGSGSSLTFGTGSLSLGGNFTTSGAFTTTLTATANTTLTLPTTGTLLTTTGSGSSLTFGTGSLSLGGNLTTSGAFTTTLTATANTSVTLPISGTLATLAGTETLTNKRVTPRIGTTTSAATITPTGDSSDQYNVTALATSATFAIPSGTPTDGQKLSIRIKDNGTGQALTWTTTSGGYRVIGTTLPTTTTASKTIYVGCVYNAADTFWDVVAVATQA